MIERRDHVQRFASNEEQRIVHTKTMIQNYLKNQYPHPITLKEMFSAMKNEGFNFTLGGFKKYVYLLRDEGKLKRVRTPRGLFWLIREETNINE